MKKIISALLHGLLLMGLGALLFGGSFFYEANILNSFTLKNTEQLVLITAASKVDVDRGGKAMTVGNNSNIFAGDEITSGGNTDIVLKFSQDGELRMDKESKILVKVMDTEEGQFAFQLESGRIWLQNSYSNADVNILVSGGVIFPGQSVVMISSNGSDSDVYIHQNDAVLGIVSTDYSATKVINETADVIINKLYLPRGTVATVYADKITQNKATIAKLLFSKLVKEFGYSVFDKTRLSTDTWLSKNIESDLLLTNKIRNERLEKIRTRGLKYTSLDGSNFKLDQSLKNVYNALTFSNERVGDRNLDALYDLLYDAQYLFDYGRKEEAEVRLTNFSTQANQLVAVYGDRLKRQYVDRVKREFEYLSFANPGDSLFELREVLEKIYVDSIKGSGNELQMRFSFLTEKLSSLGYFAENNNYKNIKNTFDDYMTSFKQLSDTYQKDLTGNITFIQRQNQALDNLFTQFPSLYRQEYFTNKLYVENKYLSLLPTIQDKPEEMQSVISQRIDFLNRLEIFFLDGQVPLVDAQNILSLLFSEINKIQLPTDYQVAVTELFNERLQDYGIFSRFLNSPEYVSSTVRGSTPRQRFEQFKKDNKQMVSIEQLRQELLNDNSIPVTDVTDVNDTTSVIVDQVETPDISTRPKVPRVKSTT